MKTMHKLACRALLGLSFLYPAYQMHMEAHYLVANAPGSKMPGDTPEWAEQIERQRGMTDEEKRAIRRADPRRTGKALEFFGSDERDARIKREARPVYERAIEVQRDVFAIAGVGLAIIGWGLWPVIRPFVRAVLPEQRSGSDDPKPTEMTCVPPSGG